ncbi:pentatricopeptide repeat-containing protein At3g29230-like [Dioscorea cayenensis subsp. rotundata]|uniref:Pentatricopeptide repeat-containing protein At3g29230-like n=1 Tax=Dioscorea cayennensis subsp. rotundata TaxID=55577 RepID=A0AB40C0F4_DIOCR|nr:pentatricopeptide repeat-containing protein At3g29230-like [Dioscorea cayenensis subsp. rotundata]
MAMSTSRPPLCFSKLHHLLQRSISISHILQIHAQFLTTSLFPLPLYSTRLLISLCSSTLLSPSQSFYADLIFAQIPRPNTSSWNTIIRLHTISSNPTHALLLFSQMRRNGVQTDTYTYPFVLKACGALLARGHGVAVHGETLKLGMDFALFVRNSLISFYCRFGDVALARCLFDGFCLKDLVSWNSMIAGYVGCGEIEEAQKLFDEMPVRDVFSWTVLIDGYGKKTGDVGCARKLFDEMPDRDLVCWNSMIDVYASVGRLGDARELFEVMPERNVVSWSILIDNYVKFGEPKEALGLFQRMLSEGTKLDKVAVVGVITACGQLGALDQGHWVHSFLKKNKIMCDVIVQTALLDMYMKCGSLELARRLFESMPERSVASWNVMIVGLGNNGYGTEAVGLFHLMEREAGLMDDLTLLGVLSACTHAGLVDEGVSIFERMMIDFRIAPKVEHYGCVVDLLGRAGRLREAADIIETMPMKPTPTLWGSLLAACRTHRYVQLAELSVKRLAELGADDAGVYVLMSNIYADEGMWDDVLRIRRLMSEKGMKKESGRSVVEVDGDIYEFVNGGSSHPCKAEIFAAIWSLCNHLGDRTV